MVKDISEEKGTFVGLLEKGTYQCGFLATEKVWGSCWTGSEDQARACYQDRCVNRVMVFLRLTVPANHASKSVTSSHTMIWYGVWSIDNIFLTVSFGTTFGQDVEFQLLWNAKKCEDKGEQIEVMMVMK